LATDEAPPTALSELLEAVTETVGEEEQLLATIENRRQAEAFWVLVFGKKTEPSEEDAVQSQIST
jgi:hypothetical protein